MILSKDNKKANESKAVCNVQHLNVLTAISARLFVIIELIESGKTYAALGILHNIYNIMPRPVTAQIEEVRKWYSSEQH